MASLGQRIELLEWRISLDADLDFDPALLVQLVQCAVDLALVGVPEVLHRRLECLVQIVPRQGPVFEYAQDQVLKRHIMLYAITYICDCIVLRRRGSVKPTGSLLALSGLARLAAWRLILPAAAWCWPSSVMTHPEFATWQGRLLDA